MRRYFIRIHACMPPKVRSMSLSRIAMMMCLLKKSNKLNKSRWVGPIVIERWWSLKRVKFFWLHPSWVRGVATECSVYFISKTIWILFSDVHYLLVLFLNVDKFKSFEGWKVTKELKLRLWTFSPRCSLFCWQGMKTMKPRWKH